MEKKDSTIKMKFMHKCRNKEHTKVEIFVGSLRALSRFSRSLMVFTGRVGMPVGLVRTFSLGIRWRFNLVWLVDTISTFSFISFNATRTFLSKPANTKDN